MASSHNVELEAAKFLHKLIQESTDEPIKLATKLYVILQHMKASGKEHSMPYQVISRAMETVINQNGIDIEALKSSRLPLTGGTQVGDPATAQYAGSSQAVGVKDSKADTEMTKIDPFGSGRPPTGPSSGGHDYYQGSVAHRSSRSFDHESPSSLDSRSANSQAQERRDTGNREKKVKDGKKATTKRKRGDSSLVMEPSVDNSQQSDSQLNAVNTRKGKANKVEPQGIHSAKSTEHSHYNVLQSSGQVEHFPSLSGSMRSMFRGQQEGQHLAEKSLDSANISSSMLRNPNIKYPEEVEVSFTHNALGLQQGATVLNSQDTTSSKSVWNQNKEESQAHRFSPNVLSAGGVHLVEPTANKGSADSEHQQPGLMKGVLPNVSEKILKSQMFAANRGDEVSAMLSTEKMLAHEGGSSNNLGGRQNNNTKTSMLKSGAPRDVGKSVLSQGSAVSCMPFKEQQLKQLRAQCLVFLAFRNGLVPKKLHLEIALGYAFPKEEERKHLIDSRKPENELQNQEQVESQSSLMTMSQEPGSSSIRGASVCNPVDDLENCHLQVGRVNQASALAGAQRQINPEMVSWTGIGSHSEGSKGHFPTSGRKDELPSHPSLSSGIRDEQHPEMPVRDVNVIPKLSQEQEDDEKSVSNDLLPSPKYTMSEKWIMAHQEKERLLDQTWAQKLQKSERRITGCFTKLKEAVSSSEDISAKTKSVIELKKLQLLGLQRRLRSDILNDFFKPISMDTDRLRSYKKYKHGRRIKQLEKYEQKMKEERQKRIRERQKEFFAEVEVHKERLDDVFKIRRERWKGFNKYVKEFHKRKERIHREKIDRIQREKINLLKINDVEGYLRMVQDAKSDRVKQLLKETEKYLQKLGSKLQEAKVVASHFEHDTDETRKSSVFEKNEADIENEDENDQAKHYLESNEKYYLMAHSIKESIAEQPTCLQGGKLREYQMNGLRWLVSLYNNHLNGILADEMGLGKTVQVIALICYLMETKNDRGPFLVVVPSSVLPGWESEINFWAPSIHRIVYSGPPEERRRLFKERVVPKKFNVLLTTYEYLMNKHDRPKLSKVDWHYIIIDEGHRIKNASCKLNAELKHYRSSHRLLLTGTPLQNNLEELWALLNFLLPNIFNSSEDFSQWFNKPFQSNGDNSPDEALLSEEENLLIINRLHQVLRPFVLRRLKHKVENELPEKIERLIRCEASAYQKLLMKRVEDNLGAIGNSKSRSVHNSVMELRNICNHPYLSHLHAEEIDHLIPKHYLPPIVRLCGKLEMLDRLLPKLKLTGHRVLFFSTMTRLLDVMEEYLIYKQYKYLRLDGHTSGGDRGALIEQFNRPDSPFFIFLLSIRAGGVGVNLQAADTVIIFDTDWNPQVDLQAQARAHRIGQKRDVLVLRFETVQTVEEQVRASAEHKLGVANQSITAGFFDNNTTAEDRREYLESLLRECKKEEAAPVLNDDALNDILARSESEIDIFESVDKQRLEVEKAAWQKLVLGQNIDCSTSVSSMPSRLVTDDDLKAFYEAMNIFEVPKIGVVSNVGVKRKGQTLGGLDTQYYGRGKRAREVRSYEEQWTEEEFEKLCQAETPDSPKLNKEVTDVKPIDVSGSKEEAIDTYLPAPTPLPSPPASVQLPQLQQNKEITPPSKRGRGRPKRVTSDTVPTGMVPTHLVTGNADITRVQGGIIPTFPTVLVPNSSSGPGAVKGISGDHVAPYSQPTTPVSSVVPGTQPAHALPSVPVQVHSQTIQSEVQAPRRRGRKKVQVSAAVPVPILNVQSQNQSIVVSGTVSSVLEVHGPGCSSSYTVNTTGGTLIPQSTIPFSSVTPVSLACTADEQSLKAQSKEETPRRRGRKPAIVSKPVPDISPELKSIEQSHNTSGTSLESKAGTLKSKQENNALGSTNIIQDQACGGHATNIVAVQKLMPARESTIQGNNGKSMGPPALTQIQNADIADVSVAKEASSVLCPPEAKADSLFGKGGDTHVMPVPTKTVGTTLEGMHSASVKIVPSSQCTPPLPSISPASQTTSLYPSQSVPVKRQGRKAPTKVEPTRRRGRNQAPVLPVHLGSAAQDPISYPVSQNKSSDGSGNSEISMKSKQADTAQEVAVVIQAQGQEIHSSGDLGGEDRKSIEESVCAVQSKQPPSLLIMLDKASGSSDKSVAYSSSPMKPKEKIFPPEEGLQTCANSASSRIPTADVNDIARVMKELFSGTCPSKTKFCESFENKDVIESPVSRKIKTQIREDQTCSAVSGNSSAKIKIGEFSSESKDVSAVSASHKGFNDVDRDQNLEGKTWSVMTNMDCTAPVLPIHEHEKQSSAEGDTKVEKEHTPILEETPLSKANAFEFESSITVSVEGMSDSKELLNEIPMEESNMETIPKVSSTAGEGNHVSLQQSPAPDVGIAGTGTGAYRDHVQSPMDSLAAVDPPGLPTIYSTDKLNCSMNVSSVATAVDLPIRDSVKQRRVETDANIEAHNVSVSGEALDISTSSEPEDRTSIGSLGNNHDPRKIPIENLAVRGNTEAISAIAESDLTDFGDGGSSSKIVSLSASQNTEKPRTISDKNLSHQADAELTGISIEPCTEQAGSSFTSQGAVEPPLTTDEKSSKKSDAHLITESSGNHIKSPFVSQGAVGPMTEDNSGNQVEFCSQEIQAAPVHLSISEDAIHSGTDTDLEKSGIPVLLEAVPDEPESMSSSGFVEKTADENLLTEPNTQIICTVCETKATEIMADARELFNENLISRSNLEGSCEIPVDASQKDDVSCPGPTLHHDDPALTRDDSVMQVCPAAPVFYLPIDKDEKGSGLEAEIGAQEENIHASDRTLDSKTTVCENEGRTSTDSHENMAHLSTLTDPREILNESTVTESTVELCTVPINTILMDPDPPFALEPSVVSIEDDGNVYQASASPCGSVVKEPSACPESPIDAGTNEIADYPYEATFHSTNSDHLQPRLGVTGDNSPELLDMPLGDAKTTEEGILDTAENNAKVDDLAADTSHAENNAKVDDLAADTSLTDIFGNTSSKENLEVVSSSCQAKDDLVTEPVQRDPSESTVEPKDIEEPVQPNPTTAEPMDIADSVQPNSSESTVDPMDIANTSE